MKKVFAVTDVPVKKSRPSRHGHGVSPSEEYIESWRLGVLEGKVVARSGTKTWTVEIMLDDSPSARVIHERNLFDSLAEAGARLSLLRLQGQE